MMAISEGASYLSSYYRNLLAKFGAQSLEHFAPLTDAASFHLSDHFVENQLKIQLGSDRTEEWFETGIQKLAGFSFWCRDQLLTVNWDIIQSWTSWLSAPEQVVAAGRHFPRMQSVRDEDECCWSVETLLVISAVLERSLGNLLFSMDVSPVPSLLRDLVFAKELEDALGRGCSTLLALLFGSPKSLNLRNLAWHGFLLPGDVPNCLVATVIVLILEIGRTLPTHNLRKRVSVVLRPLSLPSFHNPTLFLETISVPGWKRPLLQRSLELFVGRHYLSSLCLLLSELEFLLRLKFVEENDCPARLKSAETTEFYTTLTEMFERTLPDGSSNRLIQKMRTPVIEYLFDLLVMPDGPRLRDKVGHGEIDFDRDDELKGWCLHIMLALHLVNGSDEFDYKAQCHPAPILVKEISIAVQMLLELQCFCWPDTSELDLEPPDLRDNAADEVEHFTGQVRVILNVDIKGRLLLLHHALPRQRLETLFRPRAEYKLLSLLRRISAEVGKCFSNIISTVSTQSALLTDKALSRRQCQSYRKMIICLPEVCRMLVDVVVVTSLLLLKKDIVIDVLPSPTFDHMLKLLKRVLKVCENSANYVASSTNKWEDVIQFRPTLSATWESLEQIMK